MRIAMVGVRGIPATVGGAERVVDELTRELVALGHQVTVYARRHYVKDQPPSPHGRVIVTPGLRGKHLETFTHTATAMAHLLAHREADIVHIHSPGPALLSWLPVLAGRPVVLTIHAADWRRQKWSGPAKKSLRLGLRCGMKVASAVTAVSKGLADELSREFGREVVYIPNGARVVLPLPPNGIRRWGLEDGRYVLTVGRIVPEKRLDLLLQAWPGGQEANGYRLVVVGDFTESNYGKWCKNMAGGNVVFLGAVYGELLTELYSNAALMVLPSSLEGMSLTLLEAASFGRCILASDIPENRDVMGNSIVYFNEADSQDLNMKIRDLIQNKNDGVRNNYGQNARSVVTLNYSWSLTTVRFQEVYCRVLSRR